jgi:hypothetical protein
MQAIAIGFWGAFFGCAALSLVGALLAFTRSARRVALTGSLAAMLSAGYALVFLGWIPVDDVALLHRLQATMAIASSAVLAVLLFMLLGTFRQRAAVATARRVVAVLAAVAFVLAWSTPLPRALEMAVGVCSALALAGVVAAVASARRGERTGWLALGALGFLAIGMSCLDWYAFHPGSTPWGVHATSAVCGMAYLVFIAVAMWTRYAYLIEVSKVMTHGPDYDPITSMPAYELGSAVEQAAGPERRACGIIVATIGNLALLDELQGRAAHNHALFVCASRLRRLALPGAELRRLREDGFLIVFRHAPDAQQLVDEARLIMRRLSRPVMLGTSRDITALEASGAAWQARVGLGMLVEASDAQLEIAIAGARAMSRTALGFASGMAWYDEAAGGIAELPVAE